MNTAIIVPAYKEFDNIEKLINSILKVLKKPLIIIVDDSPDRRTEERIKKFENIHYIY